MARWTAKCLVTLRSALLEAEYPIGFSISFVSVLKQSYIEGFGDTKPYVDETLIIEASLGLKIGDRKFVDNKDLLTKIALNYLAIQKNDLGFPINDVCRFHLKNGADIDDIAINANVSEVGFKRSFGVMVNYRYELAKIEKNHQEYVNEKKVNISNKVKKHV